MDLIINASYASRAAAFRLHARLSARFRGLLLPRQPIPRQPLANNLRTTIYRTRRTWRPPKELRARAIIAVPFGCALRPPAVAARTDGRCFGRRRPGEVAARITFLDAGALRPSGIPIRTPAVAATDAGRRDGPPASGCARGAPRALRRPTSASGSYRPAQRAAGVQAARRHRGEVAARRRWWTRAPASGGA